MATQNVTKVHDPHDHPTNEHKDEMIKKLKKLGWHGKDLRQIIHTSASMKENHAQLKKEYKKIVVSNNGKQNA